MRCRWKPEKVLFILFIFLKILKSLFCMSMRVQTRCFQEMECCLGGFFGTAPPPLHATLHSRTKLAAKKEKKKKTTIVFFFWKRERYLYTWIYKSYYYKEKRVAFCRPSEALSSPFGNMPLKECRKTPPTRERETPPVRWCDVRT